LRYIEFKNPIYNSISGYNTDIFQWINCKSLIVKSISHWVNFLNAVNWIRDETEIYIDFSNGFLKDFLGEKEG